MAILSALFERQRTGRGRWIDVSMAQTMLYVNEHIHDQLYDGDVDPNWIRSFGTGDYLVVEVANGEQIAVSGHPAERGTFELFAGALGLDDLLEDPRFASVTDRLEHLDELRERIRAAAVTIADGAEFEERFAANQLAVEGPFGERARRHRVGCGTDGDRVGERPGRRKVRIPNPPWRFDDVPGQITRRAALPRRGQPSRARELLGYDDATIATLEADGVLSAAGVAPDS